MNLFALSFLTALAIGSLGEIRSVDENRKEPEFWRDLAAKKLNQSRDLIGANTIRRAKNVILFLGDGMGMPTISAARLLKRQNQKDQGLYLAFEHFDYTALIKTYNLDYPVPDSAGTGTAFCTGVKTNRGVIGVNGKINYGDQNCKNIQANLLETVFEKAAKKGKSVGVVTTASVTDATPAATFAHVSNRNYESSSPINGTQCKDIAKQLVEDTKFDVVLGGGRKNFLPKSSDDVGERTDGQNLFNKWAMDKNNTNPDQYGLISNRSELMSIINQKDSQIKYLFGTFSTNHMKYDKERNETDPDEPEPSLEEMTVAAIKILSKNSDGYFLMVEGAKIDKAHHANQAFYSLYDVLAFEKAIIKTMEMVNIEETLIIVTADHSHSFTHNGGSLAQQDVFGFSNFLDSNKMAFTTLLYSNGPGHQPEAKNLTIDQIKKPDYRQKSAVPLSSATHGGDDVAAYARGPSANLLRGSQEQVIIAHLMEFAACIGNYIDEPHCKSASQSAMLSFALLSLIIIINLIK